MLTHNKDHCKDANYIGVEIAEGFFDNLDIRKVQLKDKEPWANVNFIKGDVHWNKNGTKMSDLRKEKEKMLNTIYSMLCVCLGNPPEKFDWQIRDKKKVIHNIMYKCNTYRLFLNKYN